MSVEKYNSLIQAGLLPHLDPCENPNQAEEWARLSFFIVFRLHRMVREWRYKIEDANKELKSDGSPFTRLEMEMENFAKETLQKFYPKASFVGEESGGKVNPTNFWLVIDPIDGTRSFLSGFDTYSITLSILKGLIPIISIVSVPASGDIYFRIGQNRSMLFQLPNGKEEVSLHQMPLLSYSNDSAILVNMHPSRAAHPYMEKLFGLWKERNISLLRAVSGSPSLFMVEAAKTGTFYINTWQDSPTKPYDLIPALSIVAGAGCVALNQERKAVDCWRHKGVYIVGPEGKGLDILLEAIC